MAIKLIAVDLDGTLLNSGNAISPETLRTLQVAHGMGIKVVLASGRPLSGVMPFENQLGLEGSEEYAVVFNGAVVQDLSGKVLMSQEMDYRDFEVMLRLQRLAHVNLHFETTERFWTLDRDLSVQMQINAALTDNEIIPYWAFESYDIVRSLDNCIELNGIGASKGNALMNLAERLKISPEDVMVFGDQGNDVSMFENPSFKKIAMGNAIEDIKEKADFVTDDNDHNGIAKALKKFVI